MATEGGDEPVGSKVSGEFRTAMGTIERQAGKIALLSRENEKYEHIINDLHGQIQALRSNNELLIAEQVDDAKALAIACEAGNKAKDEATRAIQRCTELRDENERLRKDLEAARENKALGRVSP